ncbi:MAG TPA: hypothetical protein VGZ47_09915 [Gemmataceae bacterium]|nr:hypothetical protein [Gemmataceae bacterium]
MKYLIPPLFLAAVVGPVFAADPQLPSSGKVLVLDQERILEGDIERVGNRFRIRHTSGETWIPATDALALVADRKAAYELLKKRTNLRDPDERYRLARWCLVYGLRPQALAEAEAAAELRPKDADLARFRDDVKQLVAKPVPAAPAKVAEPANAEPAEADVTPESLSLFVSKVQPILMNVCATCHATGHGGDFRLLRTYSNSALGQRATLANVAAVSAYVNRQQPEASPLLVRAITAHGDAAAPPIRDRQFPAFRHLDDWVRMALDQPLQPKALPAAAARTAPTGPAMPMPPEPVGSSEMPFQVVSSPKEPTTEKAKPSDQLPPAMPPPPATVDKPKTEPSDPFDPLIFNRQAHPEKK